MVVASWCVACAHGVHRVRECVFVCMYISCVFARVCVYGTFRLWLVEAVPQLIEAAATVLVCGTGCVIVC